MSADKAYGPGDAPQAPDLWQGPEGRVYARLEKAVLKGNGAEMRLFRCFVTGELYVAPEAHFDQELDGRYRKMPRSAVAALLYKAGDKDACG